MNVAKVSVQSLGGIASNVHVWITLMFKLGGTGCSMVVLMKLGD